MQTSARPSTSPRAPVPGGVVSDNASELRQIVLNIPDRPRGWTLWVIVNGRYSELRPGNSGDHCKTKARAFFGGSATRGERFVITGPDGQLWKWAHPELGSPLRFTWRDF
ncbi:MAG TPA: hypothetical protein VGD81_01635 [Opitutaceae bacterium]